MRYFNINEITHDETTGAYGELVSPTDMTSDEKARIKSQMFSSIPKKNRRIQLLRAISGIAAAVIAFAGLAVTAEAMGWASVFPIFLELLRKKCYMHQKATSSQLEVTHVSPIPITE